MKRADKILIAVIVAVLSAAVLVVLLTSDTPEPVPSGKLAPPAKVEPPEATQRSIVKAQVRAAAKCPAYEVAQGQVQHKMGDCAPVGQKIQAAKVAGKAGAGLRKGGAPTGPDLSNNNPLTHLSSWQTIQRHGHTFAFFKVSEGVNFTDKYAKPMSEVAAKAGIPNGGYLFAHVCLVDPVAEGTKFAKLVKSIPTMTLRWTLDVEYGGCSSQSATRARIVTEYNTVKKILGTPGMIYSGNWWLVPKTGCLFKDLPHEVLGWISGYPNASAPCGGRLDVHQRSDREFNGVSKSDMNVLVSAKYSDLQAKEIIPPPSPRAIALCTELNQLRAKKKAKTITPEELVRKKQIHRAFERVKHGYRYVCDEKGVRHQPVVTANA